MNIENQKKCIVTIPEDMLADLRVFVVLHGGSIKDAEPNDEVEITCYGKKETMKRQEAIAFYREAMEGSDGCEKERYTNIYLGLMSGATVVLDEEV